MKGNSGIYGFAALVLAAMAMTVAACMKQQLQTTYDSQDKRIDSFIQSQLSSSKALRTYPNGGSNRLVIVEGEGVDSLSTSGSVTFYYAAYTFSGSISSGNLFATNHEQTIAASGWTTLSGIDTSPVTLKLDDSDMVEGLRMGLFGVKKGQECYIIFSGKYGFGSKPIGTIPANSALLYHIWVENIDNN